jgi:hypothetical protein
VLGIFLGILFGGGALIAALFAWLYRRTWLPHVRRLLNIPEPPPEVEKAPGRRASTRASAWFWDVVSRRQSQQPPQPELRYVTIVLPVGHGERFLWTVDGVSMAFHAPANKAAGEEHKFAFVLRAPESPLKTFFCGEAHPTAMFGGDFPLISSSGQLLDIQLSPRAEEWLAERLSLAEKSAATTGGDSHRDEIRADQWGSTREGPQRERRSCQSSFSNELAASSARWSFADAIVVASMREEDADDAPLQEASIFAAVQDFTHFEDEEGRRHSFSRKDGPLIPIRTPEHAGARQSCDPSEPCL